MPYCMPYFFNFQGNLECVSRRQCQANHNLLPLCSIVDIPLPVWMKSSNPKQLMEQRSTVHNHDGQLRMMGNIPPQQAPAQEVTVQLVTGTRTWGEEVLVAAFLSQGVLLIPVVYFDLQPVQLLPLCLLPQAEGLPSTSVLYRCWKLLHLSQAYDPWYHSTSLQTLPIWHEELLEVALALL